MERRSVGGSRIGSFHLVSVDGRRLGLQLADPSGGMFGAAGDFDWVMFPASDALPELGLLDEYGEHQFRPEQLPGVLLDIEELLRRMNPEPSGSRGAAGMRWRGLLRLKTMVEYCLTHPDVHLVRWGD